MELSLGVSLCGVPCTCICTPQIPPGYAVLIDDDGQLVLDDDGQLILIPNFYFN